MKKVSLKDIASKVGVAPSTVSFVLNGKSKEMRISDRLAEKIRAVADDAGYRPNKIAVSLRTGNSKILGLIVEDISNNFFASLAKTIEQEAEQFGYNVVFCSTENDDLKGSQLLKILSQQQVDGYLITPTPGMLEDIRQLQQHHQPLVLMDRGFAELQVATVLADNFNGTVAGLNHLIGNGYKNIGFVTTDMGLNQMKQREDAYYKTLEKSGIPAGETNVLRIAMKSTPEKMVQQIETFLRSGVNMDGIFFATNYLGIAGLESIRNIGLRIPEDLGVLCFDDHDIFKLHTPAITTICQPTRDIAISAVQQLISQIMKPGTEAAGHVMEFATHLVIRESSRPVKKF